MDRTVTPSLPQDTTARLQQAEQAGLPLMIPGARARQTMVSEQVVTPHDHSASVDGRDRLEHQREGGGAPSERAGRSMTWFARLWRSAMASRA
jgi:hypothetical protein